MPMLEMTAEDQAKLNASINETARILRKYTDQNKLQDFESIEIEVREQMLNIVGPQIGEFFFSEGGTKTSGKTRSVNTVIGEVEVSRKQARRLGMTGKSPISPALEKCCLRLCANVSYQQSEEDLRELMGINIGHSSLQRLVQRVDLPPAQTDILSEGVSVDGGKIRVREQEEGNQWKDYKLVSLHGGICEAFFQDPQGLLNWSNSIPLSPILTCLGDGHPGIWNIISPFGQSQVFVKREILDWFHLKENLYKVGGSLRRLERVENFLWQGWVDKALQEFKKLQNKKAVNFCKYLETHRERIPCYSFYQKLGITIGSGDVESKIKQVAARVKITGAQWARKNVERILRLRCAYLNHSSRLSIYAHA